VELSAEVAGRDGIRLSDATLPARTTARIRHRTADPRTHLRRRSPIDFPPLKARIAIRIRLIAARIDPLAPPWPAAAICASGVARVSAGDIEDGVARGTESAI